MEKHFNLRALQGSVTIGIDDILHVWLDFYGSTEYSWYYSLPSSDLTLINETAKQKNGPPPEIQKCFSFQPVKSGKAYIVFSLARSWEKDRPLSFHKLVVTIEDSKN